MIIVTGFNSILELISKFPNQRSCIDHLESIIWGDDIVSPFDSSSKVYKCKHGYKCKNTGKYFNVKIGTMFEGSNVRLQKWFLAIWLITSHKKGISSAQLAKDISVTQKTAWFMLQRIRNCLQEDKDDDCEAEYVPEDGLKSLMKRSFIGIYHWASKKHLKRYLNEMIFRYDNRDIGECERFNLMLSDSCYRTKYKQLILG